jgi:hypothetical protein
MRGMRMDMPLLCRDATRRVLATYMPRWESAVTNGEQHEDDGTISWTSGNYVVTAVGDSLRLVRLDRDDDDSMTVILPPSGGDRLGREEAVAIVRVLREAVRTAMDPHCREAGTLVDGLMELAYDVAAAHMDSADRVQLNVGIGRPDAVRLSDDDGPGRGVLRDAPAAWSGLLAGSRFRHAVAEDPGGGNGSVGHVVIVQGVRIAAPMKDLSPMEVLRRLASLPEHLRNPSP